VVGAQTQIASVCIGPEDDMEQRRQDILRAIAEVDSGDGAVLLTDMFGVRLRTWRFRSWTAADRGHAGVNLPMLIKLASPAPYREPRTDVLGAQEAGRKYITSPLSCLSDAPAG